MSNTSVEVTQNIVSVDVQENNVVLNITSSPVAVEIGSVGPQGASYNQGDPIYVTVRNATGSTLAKGTIVYTSGGNGTHTQVTPALATSDGTSARVLGWLAADIANNASGLCQVEGYLDGIDTQGIAEGTQLYLSGTVAGGFQTAKPQAPIHLVYVGVAVKASSGNGRVYVKVQNGYELDELHDTQIISPTDGDVLEYDSATGLWKNRNLATAGIAKLAGGNDFTGSQTVTGTVIGDKVLVVKGASGQTANLFEVQDSTGTFRVRVNQVGNSTFAGNITSQNNALFTPFSAATVPLTVQGAASQTASFIEVQNSSSTTLFRVNSSGFGVLPLGLIAGGASPIASTTNTMYSTSATNVGLAIRGAASQTANLQTWQDSASTILARISNLGEIVTSTTVYANNIQNNTSFWSINNNGMASFTARAATNIPLTLKGATSQTADLTQWQNDAGTVLANINSAGILNMTRAIILTQSNAGEVGIRVKGAVSQTGDLLQLQNSGAVNQFRVDSAGMTVTNSLGVAGSPSGISYSYFTTPSASSIPVVVRGAASQTANLLEIQDSTSAILSRFTSLGTLITTSGISTNNSTNTGANSLFVNNSVAGNAVAVLRGAASQSASVLAFQNDSGSFTANFTAPVNNVNRLNLGGTDLSATLGITVHAAGGVGQVIRAAASQTANLQEWQESNAGVPSAVTAFGGFRVRTFGTSYTDTSLAVQAGYATEVPIRVRAAASQTANMQEWQNSAGTMQARIDQSGNFETLGIGIVRGDLRVGTGSYYSAAANVLARATTEKGLVVRGQPSQTASHFETQDTSGTTRFYIDAAHNANFSSASWFQNSTGKLTIGLSSATAVGLTVKGAASQTANLFEAKDSSDNVWVSISPTGAVNSSNSTGYQIAGATYYGSLNGGQTARIQAGASVAANPHLVVRGVSGATGNLQEWQDSAGTVLAKVTATGNATFGNIGTNTTSYMNGIADTSATKMSLSFNSTAYGLQLTNIQPAGIGFIVKGATSQSADLQQWQDSAGTRQGYVSAGGNTITFPAVNAAYSMTAYSGGTTVVPLTVKGIASQTANLQEWQDSAGTILARIGATGTIVGAGLNVQGSFASVASVGTGGATNVGMIIRGVASQTANLQEWQDSASVVNAKVEASGQASFLRGNFRGAVYGTGTYFGAVNVLQESGGHGLVLQGRDSQSVDLLRLRLGATSTNDFIKMQNSSGTDLVTVTSTGIVNIVNASLRVNTAGTSFGARINVQTDGAAVIGEVIRATASQTANLTEWQNSAGTVLARVTASGEIQSINDAIRAVQLLTFNYWGRLQEQSAGAKLTLKKLTATATAPNADEGAIYFRDGTTAGTLKLVVKAGPTGAETTILDNIPQ